LCNAVSSVSRTTELKPNDSECAYGGTKLESGLDADGDHELDTTEVSSSALICNGTNLAVRTIALEVGSEECPAGGSVIETGIDTDGDTELDDSEVSKRQVLCQPPQLLFETKTIKENDDTCPHGGLRVTSGHDDGQPEGIAGDGILQSGENELDKSICLAPTNVLVSGGSGSCTVTPGQRGSTAMLWSTLLGLLGIVVRRRRTLGRKN
jgi:MYXO-CTERM domain-containing protein